VSINCRINISSSIIIRVTYRQHEELLGEKPNGIRTIVHHSRLTSPSTASWEWKTSKRKITTQFCIDSVQ
jgi:hypothetical protein